MSSSFLSLVASARTWVVVATSALCLACLVSDVRVGYSRSAYKARWVKTIRGDALRGLVVVGWVRSQLLLVCHFINFFVTARLRLGTQSQRAGLKREQGASSSKATWRGRPCNFPLGNAFNASRLDHLDWSI